MNIYHKAKKKLNKFRYGKFLYKDNFINSSRFYNLNKKINFVEFNERKKIKSNFENSLIEKIDRNIGFKKISLNKINNKISVLENLRNLRNNFDNIDWKSVEQDSKKKYLLSKRIEIDENIKQLIHFVLPVVANYIGTLPILLDASYWLSPNNKNNNIGSQKWHMDHEDVRQLKVFIGIDHDINDDTGSLNLIDKETTKKIYFQLSKYNKMERGEKIDDIEFYRILKNKDKVIKCHQNLEEIYFVDTCSCYHYGSRQAIKKRKLLQLHFTSAFSTVVPFIFRKNFKQNGILENVLCYYKNNINYFDSISN